MAKLEPIKIEVIGLKSTLALLNIFRDIVIYIDNNSISCYDCVMIESNKNKPVVDANDLKEFIKKELLNWRKIWRKENEQDS